MAGNDELSTGLRDVVQRYTDLLTPFIEHRLDPKSFQTQFLQRYLKDNDFPSDDVFFILDRYFADVEEFVADPNLYEPRTTDVSEAELRVSTRRLLERAGLA